MNQHVVHSALRLVAYQAAFQTVILIMLTVAMASHSNPNHNPVHPLHIKSSDKPTQLDHANTQNTHNSLRPNGSTPRYQNSADMHSAILTPRNAVLRLFREPKGIAS